MEAFVSLAVLLLTVLLFFIAHRYTYWRQRKVPNLAVVFPFGSLYNIKSFNIMAKLQEVYTEFKGDHPIAGMYFFLKPVAVALDFEVIKAVLVKDFSNFTNRMMFENSTRQPISNHLFNMRDGNWKKMRNRLTPTFTSGKMKFMFPTIVEVAAEFDIAMRSMLECSNIVEIREILARYTIDVIGSCAFGIQCNSLKNPDSEFFYYGRKITENPEKAILLRIFLQSHRELALKLGLTPHDHTVLDFFMRSVEETVALREANNIQRADFMKLLIDLKNQRDADGQDGLTIGEVAAQAFIFFAAGFETSASNMAFLLFELAKNPDVQKKVREEVNTVLEKHNNNITYEAIFEMTYLGQCINETLRKYPALVSLSRTANDKYKIPGTKLVIEKGTHVLIPVHAIHYDPDIYPNPTHFDPDRFEAESVRARDAMSFLPFGDGPRNCIGLRFGVMQVRVGLMVLLRSFRFSMAPDTPDELVLNPKSFVTMPNGKLFLKVEKI